jgi:hypothetical protein
MSTMSISTLELLEQSDMPPAYARAIAKAIEADFTHRLGELPTKMDLRSEINGIRLEMGEMRSELRSEVAAVKTALSVDIRDVKSDVVRWLFMAIMGQTALFSGSMYFLLQLATRPG